MLDEVFQVLWETSICEYQEVYPKAPKVEHYLNIPDGDDAVAARWARHVILAMGYDKVVDVDVDETGDVVYMGTIRCKGSEPDYLITSQEPLYAAIDGVLYGAFHGASIDAFGGALRNIRNPVPGLLYKGQ